METKSPRIFKFGDFCLEPESRLLLDGGRPVPLTPKAFDTLLALVRRNGRVVRKEELLDEVWPDTFVEEATLAQNVFTLRKALGQNKEGCQYIETVPKLGYRFVADVEEVVGDQTELVLERRTRTHIVTEELEQSLSPERSGHAETNGAYPFGYYQPSASAGATDLTTRADTAAWQLIQRKPRIWLWGAAAAVVLLILSFVGYVSLKRAARTSRISNSPSSNMRFAKLTTSGKVWRAAISPDGRYVAYVQSDRSGQGLWLKQTSSSRSIQIVEPAVAQFQGLSFAPDGSSIYYAVYEKGRINSNLYQIPVLGGTPRKIIEDVDSTVAFAPDGSHFAFVRNEANMKEASLVIADTATGSERRLLTHAGYVSLSNEGPAWSPDGKVIVVPERIGDPSRGKWKLLAVDAKTGERQEFDSHEWDAIGQTAWLSDGQGLIFAGRENPSSVMVYRLWKISYPSAETRMITNDLNSYTNVGITSGSSSVLTIQSDRVANFFVAPKNALDKPLQITTGSGDKPSEIMGLAWTPDNHIVYGSSASGDIELWIMDADGSNQKQLTADQNINFKPSVTPDGRSIVFVSRKGGAPHIWKMDIDGTNPIQLTDGNAETYPSVSPDGAYILYSSVNAGVPKTWRIPVSGGKAEQLISEPAYYPCYSPDGKYIAALVRPENEDKWKLAILPKDGGEPVKKLDVSPTIFHDGGLRWSPDSQAIQYVEYREGAGNIWSHPLNGDTPRQLTNFGSGQIFRFGWSFDGRQLAIDHGMIINDAVLITNFG